MIRLQELEIQKCDKQRVDRQTNGQTDAKVKIVIQIGAALICGYPLNCKINTMLDTATQAVFIGCNYTFHTSSQGRRELFKVGGH